MPSSNAVVLRGGIVTEDSIRSGAEWVDTIDKVYNLSVQITPGTAKQDTATINMLLGPIPNAHYALTFAINILNKGGTIAPNPILPGPGNPGNPYHALVSGITVEDLFNIFKINKH
jgi:hypothetical protein